MAAVIVRASAVRQQQPAPRRDAVGLVVKPFREHLGQVLDRRRAQQPGMNRGDAISTVRADNGQVGHAHVLGRAFLDQAHPRDTARIAGKRPARHQGGGG